MVSTGTSPVKAIVGRPTVVDCGVQPFSDAALAAIGHLLARNDQKKFHIVEEPAPNFKRLKMTSNPALAMRSVSNAVGDGAATSTVTSTSAGDDHLLYCGYVCIILPVLNSFS